MDVQSVWALLPESWVYYAVAAALGYTLVEFIDEHLLEEVRPKDATEDVTGVGTLTLISGFFGIVLIPIFGLIALIWGVSILIEFDQALQAIIVGALEVIWMIPYLHALNRGGTINVAPLYQAIPVFTFVLGFFVFGETPVMQHIAGSAIIVAGALLLNLRKGTLNLDLLTIGLMFLTSLIISFVYFLFKETVVEGNFIASVFWSSVGMVVMSVVIWLGYKPYRRQFNSFVRSSNNKAAVWQTANEGLNALSVLASHLANVKAPSVMVATAFNAFHPIFTLLVGWILGKQGSEKHANSLEGGELYKKIIAVLMIASGTVLVAF